MQLTKHHGLGNDFLVALVDAVPPGAVDLARAWCHRTRGIGADGLIFATASTVPGCDLDMALFNADGSRAEISGNGLRCLAQAALRHEPDRSELVIVAGGHPRRIVVMGREVDTISLSVEMGPVNAGPALPDRALLSRPTFGFGRVETADVGNPHVVIEVQSHDGIDVEADGAAIEALWKPTGINVHFLTRSGPDRISLLHWERGSGVTEACGSGATVAATIAHRWDLVGDHVTVHMPGGDAEVIVGPTATLIGPATHIADIEVTHA